MKFEKFKTLCHKVICESATSISAEQIVIDCIEDEFIPEGYIIKDNWKLHISPMVEFIEANIPDEQTILTIDYIDLINLVEQALREFDLIGGKN